MSKVEKGNWYLRGNEMLKVIDIYKDDICEKAVVQDKQGSYRFVNTKSLKG